MGGGSDLRRRSTPGLSFLMAAPVKIMTETMTIPAGRRKSQVNKVL